MARKSNPLYVPPLEEALPNFRGFSPEENKTHRLEELLRCVAERYREKQAHPFYPMRTVSGFFGVALPSVSKIYRKFERDGLLIRRRSSRTDFAPLENIREVTQQGVCRSTISRSPGRLEA